jgi:acetyl/propionyl-CoA carboxylase alpha subunit
VHLFERECSAQRRHQKVIEESPAPLVSQDLRDRLTASASRAAAAVSYTNAGTIEFLVDAGGAFYFLEMNTRLQVEHGVTELVTGTDLVQAQLLVASGERLPWAQSALRQRGHAIEARVYAEDPSREFLPQAGRLLLYREPRFPGLRIDSGVVEGDTVAVHYDPLLAKVIAYGETRERASARLTAGLMSYPILGVQTNTAFLLAILRHPHFRSGAIDTGFLDREAATLAASAQEETPDFVEAAMAAHRTIGPTSVATQTSWDPWNG